MKFAINDVVEAQGLLKGEFYTIKKIRFDSSNNAIIDTEDKEGNRMIFREFEIKLIKA